jgi:hypothetical protein
MPSKNQVEAYIKKVGGKRAQEAFSIMAKNQQFVNAYGTPLGQELLKDIESHIEYLSRKVILSDDAKLEDKMLLRAYIQIAEDWSAKINKVAKTLTEITSSTQPDAT